MKLIYLLALVVMATVANVVSAGIPKCSIWHMMGRIPDETDRTRYYQCIFAIPRLTICPIIADKQTYFDPTLEMCLWSETCNNPGPSPEPGTSVTPGTSTSTEPTTATISGPMTCDESIIIPDPPVKPSDCEGTGPCNGPIKGKCTEYYQWTGTEKTLMKCLENHYYNVKIQACDLQACPKCT